MLLEPTSVPSPDPVFGGRTPAPSLPPEGVWVGGTGVLVEGALVSVGAGVLVFSGVGVEVGVWVLMITTVSVGQGAGAKAVICSSTHIVALG